MHNASPRVSNTFDDIQSHSKADQILGVHAITMQALLRDEKALSGSSSKHPSLSSTTRHSRNRPQSVPARKASTVLPPPIDTSAPGPPHLPSHFIRTPYSFHPNMTFPKLSPGPASSTSTREAVITLSIRRHARRGAALSDAGLRRRVLAAQLRVRYARLAGPWRLVSARALQRITVSAALAARCPALSGL